MSAVAQICSPSPCGRGLGEGAWRWPSPLPPTPSRKGRGSVFLRSMTRAPRKTDAAVGGGRSHRTGRGGGTRRSGEPDRAPRPALPPAGRAGDHRRRLRRAAPAQRRDRGTLPASDPRRLAVQPCRQRAGERLRQDPPPRADAVARQCDGRRGVRRILRPCASLRRACRRRAAGVRRRTEDRRAVDQPDLRERSLRARRDARRRHRGRGRHRQSAHHGVRADAPEGSRAGADRDPRRGLHDQGRLPEDERGAGRGGPEGVRQSAQRRRRQSAPARSAHHRRSGRCRCSPTPRASRASRSPIPTGTI